MANEPVAPAAQTAEKPTSEEGAKTPPPEAKAQAATKETPPADGAKASESAKAAEAANAEAKPEAGKEAPKPPTAPEKYELKLGKDSLLSKDDVEAVSAYAKELGLSNEQAQKIVAREEQSRIAQRDAMKARNDGWVKELEGDKEFGGEKFKENAELGHRALERFGDEKLKKGLSDTGLGNHPALFRFFARIGRAMGEDSTVAKGGEGNPVPAEKKSTAEKLYGGTK